MTYRSIEESTLFLDIREAGKDKEKFSSLEMFHNNMLGRRLPDHRASALILDPVEMEDTRRMSHVIQVMAIGKGYRKERRPSSHFFQGSKVWGTIVEDIDVQHRSLYYVHGIEPGDYVFLKTPFILGDGRWFAFPLSWMEEDEAIKAWVDSLHPDDRQRTFLLDADGNTVEAVRVRLYIIGADEAIGILELEEGEDESTIQFGISRGDLMSAN